MTFNFRVSKLQGFEKQFALKCFMYFPYGSCWSYFIYAMKKKGLGLLSPYMNYRKF